MKQKLFGRNQIVGLILIVISALVWHFRPFAYCKWWQLFCHAGSITTGWIFMGVAIILLIVGVVKLLSRNRRRR